MSERISYESVLAYDRMASTEIESLELHMLRDLLCHARDTVPFYAETFANTGFDPAQFGQAEQLQALPLLDKAIILQSPSRFRSTAFDDSALRVVQTGGSTGEPFRILTVRDDPRIQGAFNWALWHRLGIRPGDPTVALSGMAHKSSPVHTFVEHRVKDAMLRVHRPSLDAMPPWQDLIASIRSFQPVMIRGFPSIVAEMALAMIDLGEPVIPSVRGVSLSSEDILPCQREVIERAFGVRCFGFYGQSEHCVLAMECESPDAYHIYPGYAHIEIVDDEGRPITTPGRRGEVVGTSLLNYAMPLIRYRTGDLAEWDSGECPCGRQHKRLAKLAGRKRSRVALPDGRAVYFGSDVYDEIWNAPEMFRQIQFEQSCADELNIRVVPFADTNRPRLQQFIEDCLRRTLCDRLVYRTEFVSSVERTSSGKYLLFLQKHLH
jgi:phenylacetate-CoA ligase